MQGEPYGWILKNSRFIKSSLQKSKIFIRPNDSSHNYFVDALWWKKSFTIWSKRFRTTIHDMLKLSCTVLIFEKKNIFKQFPTENSVDTLYPLNILPSFWMSFIHWPVTVSTFLAFQYQTITFCFIWLWIERKSFKIFVYKALSWHWCTKNSNTPFNVLNFLLHWRSIWRL